MDKEQEEKYELNVMNELDSFGMTPQKINTNGSIVEDDEEGSPSKIQVLPSNQEVENALHSSGTSDKVQKISFVEEYDEEEERKYNTNESPKKMQLMPPSMTSESGSSYGHARNYTETGLEDGQSPKVYHIRHKSNADPEQEDLMRRKANTCREDSDLPSSSLE